MADLTFIEKDTIENFLEMKSGYVMDFSDRSFQEFIVESVKLDINSTVYYYASNSKANRLRAFLKIESNYTVGKLLSAFCDYWLARVHAGLIDYRDEENLYKECLRIAERLKESSIVEHVDAIKPNSEDKDFDLLSKSIKESIENNLPEAALDRLHTFLVKYVRRLCEIHEISYEKAESLNSIFGKYVKHLANNDLIETSMAEKILKFSINVIEAFNDVRNNRSFAHDNPVLNYEESILIFNNISNTIKYLDSLEKKIQSGQNNSQPDFSNLPF